ncbi:MAG: maltose/maltodextrin ABC transporter substrate-binding protein MalE [Burkholderiales bacterium]|nr:maltose/maltodextrin ABC transporter substrate-binding protein MalE [Burkholderiales bacterium]
MNLTRRRLSLAGLACAAAPLARAATPEPLVVWYSVEGAKGIRKLGEAFTAATGVTVVVETPDGIPGKFQQAASAGKGPDICTYAHDRIGEWVAGGLMHAVNPSRAVRADVDPLAWQAFDWRGRTWGYPYAIDAITLVYNKALVQRAPTSFDEVFELEARLAPQGKHAIVWDYTNNYFSWPLMAAHGGYAFKRRPDGSYDATDTGVANAGALRGAELIARLVREGVMAPGLGYAEMEAAMAQGRAAMMINGAWSWVNLKRAGIDFGVARIPAVAGKAAAPFIGIRGFLINRATRQRELAVEFIENYLLSPAGLRLIDQAEPIGAPASQAYYAELRAQPGVGENVTAIMASARDGVLTPPVPEMGRFWAAMKSSLTNLSEGRQTPREALEAAARRIKDAG